MLHFLSKSTIFPAVNSRFGVRVQDKFKVRVRSFGMLACASSMVIVNLLPTLTLLENTRHALWQEDTRSSVSGNCLLLAGISLLLVMPYYGVNCLVCIMHNAFKMPYNAFNSFIDWVLRELVPRLAHDVERKIRLALRLREPSGLPIPFLLPRTQFNWSRESLYSVFRIENCMKRSTQHQCKSFETV